VQSTLGVGGCGREIFASATCQLQFAKASEYIRLYRYSGKLALAPMHLRRARVVGRSCSAGAQPLTHVCTVGACGKNNSAYASDGPAGGRRVAACLGRWRALPQRAARREVQKPIQPCWLQIVQQNFEFSLARLSQKRGSSPPVSHHNQNSAFSPAAVSAGSPL
jgi:hypothetical protein